MLKHMPLWVLIRALNHLWSLSGPQKREDHYTEERYEGKNDCMKASVCGKQLEYVASSLSIASYVTFFCSDPNVFFYFIIDVAINVCCPFFFFFFFFLKVQPCTD